MELFRATHTIKSVPHSKMDDTYQHPNIFIYIMKKKKKDKPASGPREAPAAAGAVPLAAAVPEGKQAQEEDEEEGEEEGEEGAGGSGRDVQSSAGADQQQEQQEQVNGEQQDKEKQEQQCWHSAINDGVNDGGGGGVAVISGHVVTGGVCTVSLRTVGTAMALAAGNINTNAAALGNSLHTQLAAPIFSTRAAFKLWRNLPCPLRQPPVVTPGSMSAGAAPGPHARTSELHPQSSPFPRHHFRRTPSRHGRGRASLNTGTPAPLIATHPAITTGPAARMPRGCHNTRRLAAPSAASGATGGAPGWPTSPLGAQDPGPASAAGATHFNPRYTLPLQQAQQHHHHLSGAHPAPQANPQPHPAGTSGRSGNSWATAVPGSLASASGGAGGAGGSSGSSSAPLRQSTPSQSSRPAAGPTADQQQQQPQQRRQPPPLMMAAAENRGKSAGAEGSAASAASAAVATTASATARQPHGGGPAGKRPPPEPYKHHQQQLQQQQQLPTDGGLWQQGAGESTQLERLYIKDFALVSEQTVRLGPGLNAITGESGSGKSVLVEAFSQVLGAPAPQECVRAPAEVAVIEGTFVVGEQQREAVMQLLAACGLPLTPRMQRAAAGGGGGGGGDDGGSDGSDRSSEVSGSGALRLTARREILVASPSGGLRSRVYLNGAASSLRVLRELGSLMVDMNGQHSTTSLRDSAKQLDILDRIAGTSPLADSYCAALSRLRQLEGRLDELDELDDEGERATMQKIVDAVAKLRVQPGEERELRRTLKKMEARRAAVEQCGLVRMALCGEGGRGGVTDALRTIEAQLNAILAQEEQNRAMAAAAAAAAKGLPAGGARGADGDVASSGSGAGAAGAATSAAAATTEDEALEEDGEDEEAGATAAGLRLMEEALEQVAAAKETLASAETTVRAYARRYQFSQADHDATSDRLARIERLMKQASAAIFGAGRGGRSGGGVSRIISTEQLLEVAEECSSKLAAYYEMEGQREEWEAQLGVLVDEIRTTALQLSSCRRAAAAALRSAVESCLRELAMGGSRFDVRIGWAEEPRSVGAAAEGLYVGEEEAEEAGLGELGGCTYVMGPRGLDQVEFLLAAGPSEPLRPLAAVASGGESARVMLALKAAQAQAAAGAGGANGAPPSQGQADARSPPMTGGGVPILILDELDSGIGARLGSAVACYAAHHIKVQKQLSQHDQLLKAGSSTHANAASGGAGGGAPSGTGVTGGGAAAAASTAGRVTTTFVPLMTFEERCEEVAAMLGLDRGVAEEMLCGAQNQVYPRPAEGGEAPHLVAPRGLFPTTEAANAVNAVTAAQHQEQQRCQVLPLGGGGEGAAAAAPLPTLESSSSGSSGSGGSGSSRGEDAWRVVQDTSCAAAAAAADDGNGSSRFAGGFSVVVSPAMDPNAVLLGYEAASISSSGGDSSSGGSGGSRRVPDRTINVNRGDSGGSDNDSEDFEAEEAELSVQLLAGVEAAAMEHLKRMEAQAKAAAAAAAAAAAIVTPAEASVLSPQPSASPGLLRESSAEAALAKKEEEDDDAAAAAEVAGVLRQPVPASKGEAEAGCKDEEKPGEQDQGPPRTATAGGRDLEVAKAAHSAASGASGAHLGDEGDGGGNGNGNGNGNGGGDTTSVQSSVWAPAVSSTAAPTLSDDDATLGFGGGAGDVAGSETSSGAAAAAASSNGLERLDAVPAAAAVSGSGGGFVVTVRPSRPPLPYDFSSGSSVGNEEELEPTRGPTKQGDNVVHLDEQERGSAIPYDAHYEISTSNQARQEQQELSSPYVEAASYYEIVDAPHNMAAGNGGATYSLGGEHGGGAAGGRFVLVPSGREDEFSEMFRTIMSFSREDYAAEAVRSYEATLVEASGRGRGREREGLGPKDPHLNRG
ncbi:hypothetical protein VOLCADRAFT_117930 [Volvox carteri f. nagariensis]|uniref:DNA repair protein RecN n=1 Tax=Volvox carteri f. nagariensis TaxID=3068 RepID=D8TZB5_VOLCA|nr:uncharacterized protein VOLCADRAFT_117930 [Volvox carteri f. nagariensis]EFJ47154.1 hypothetical protein VOLCADRAFT_117930 [Volvox carteri f. nagariensis]|eukprot:XP_002951703.1 hypothetical protein VOLCADRAFT_117930 [Volvox carteri f. nagariensis]